MRFLANENFPLASVRRLREAGHDVLAITELTPGARDGEVLTLALRDRRIVLTFDRDYGELIYRDRQPVPPGLVFLRFVPESPLKPAEVMAGLLDLGVELEGRFTVVESNRVRQRPLPPEGRGLAT